MKLIRKKQTLSTNQKFHGMVSYGIGGMGGAYHHCDIELKATSIEITWFGGKLDSIPYLSIRDVVYPSNWFMKHIYHAVRLRTEREKIQLSPFHINRFICELKKYV